MSKSAHRELSIPADTRHLAQVRAAVMEVIGNRMFPAVKANLVALAVDEAVANIMEHAYTKNSVPDAAREVQVILDATPEKLSVVIRDKGVAFDPCQAPEIDLNAHIRAGHSGGLGIFLMRRIMDEIQYSHKNGQHNELRMVKYAEGVKKSGKSGLMHKA